MLATCNVYRAHRHGSESPYPGSTPGLNPCNHLAWRACGPWRTHRHNTYYHIAWLASEERDHLRQTWNDLVWHGMTWGAGAAPKGPDPGEARAEATRGVAGGSEPPPRPGRGRRRAGGAEAVAAVVAAEGAEAVAAVAAAAEAAAAVEAAGQGGEGVATNGG
jgi:hypothetical protein